MTRRRTRALLVVRIRLRLVRVVELVAAPQHGPVGEIVVELSDDISLESDALSREIELGRVSGDRAVGDREEGQIPADLRRAGDARLGLAGIAADTDAHEAVSRMG